MDELESGERHADRTTRDGKGQYTRTTDTARRDAEAAELRSKGLSYQAIADEMGYASKSGAWEAVQRALKAIVEEPAENLRQLERERLDRMYEAASAALEANPHSLAAITTLLKISESRRKLEGLDAPAKVNVSGGLKVEIVGVDMDQLR
jgi:predicted transcriptional regulator